MSLKKILISSVIFSAGCTNTLPLPYAGNITCWDSNLKGESSFIDKDEIIREGRCRVSTTNDWRVIQAAPFYPKQERINGIEGYVILKHQISKDGKATNITVLESFPREEFDKSAINSLKLWQFKYNGKNPQDLDKWYKRKFNFKISTDN